jgi:hypothetical protein
LFGAAEKVFWDFRDTEGLYRAHFAVDGRNAPVRIAPQRAQIDDDGERYD